MAQRLALHNFAQEFEMTKLQGLTLIVIFASVSSMGWAHPPQLKEFDVDGDGNVNRAEVELGVLSHIQTLDSNGDGFVSADELHAEQSRRELARIQRKLDRADTNGDGLVGGDEFGAHLVERMMRRDQDGDAVISGAEWTTHELSLIHI